MKVLGIETSCDETAAAIVEDGRHVLANVVASQIDLHAKTGGVVPEVAAREHVLKIMPVLEECMSDSGCGWDDIDLVAVTKGPGLISSLIIGTEVASVISYVKRKPVVEVNHIAGHIYANFLEHDEDVAFPVLVLTVSGGHNEIILMKGHGDFTVLGETRDDAAGEAFDKVARLLGLGYPGGPAISKIANDGDCDAFSLPRAYLEKDSLDFSFSGLKTAVLDVVKKQKKIDDAMRADIAASFQEAVCDVLSDKLMLAAKMMPSVKEIHLAGGVSANTRLREMVEAKLPDRMVLRYPDLKYCTDNAAMIAAAGYYLRAAAKDRHNVVPSTSYPCNVPK